MSEAKTQGFDGERMSEGDIQNQTLADFGLVVKESGVQAFREEDFIVSKGVISPNWKPSCRESPKTTEGEHACEVRVFDEYWDQVTLEFMYSEASRYRFKQPQVSAIGGRAQPQIQDFSHDVDEKTGEITVRHGCTRATNETTNRSQVVLTLPVNDKTKLVMTWDKLCGYGEHKKLDYGWFAGSGEDMSKTVSFRDEGAEQSGKTRTMFGPSVLSTRIYLTLQADAHSQYYDRPVVDSHSNGEGEAVGVELRGSNFGGVIAATAYSVFDVMYTCHTKGRSTVSVTVGLGPFKAARMRWGKDCGGGAASRLHVGTSTPLWGYAANANVVLGGRAVGAFTRTGNGSTEGRLAKHRGRLGRRMFYVWTTRDEARVGATGEEIGEASAHAEDERVLAAGVRMRRDGGLGTRAVGVWTRCKRRGRSRVAVTLMVRDRDAVEWWIEDECSRERLRGRRGGWRVTAATMMYATMALFATAMAAWMRRAVRTPSKVAVAWRKRAGW